MKTKLHKQNAKIKLLMFSAIAIFSQISYAQSIQNDLQSANLASQTKSIHVHSFDLNSEKIKDQMKYDKLDSAYYYNKNLQIVIDINGKDTEKDEVLNDTNLFAMMTQSNNKHEFISDSYLTFKFAFITAIFLIFLIMFGIGIYKLNHIIE